MKTKRIRVMDTSFRDGFQSCLGARIATKDYLPAIIAAKEAGITHFETAGGALFQSMAFYNNENPFDNMDQVRAALGPDITLQSLSRGVNVVGLISQCSEIIDLHAKMFFKHGITTVRNFDALNDVENLVYSGECIKKAGLNHEVVIALMGLPPGCEGAHTADFYMKTLRKILDSGLAFDSVCFKDASGTCPPQRVYDSVKAARALLGQDAHIRFHSHETAGISIISYRAALDAGANGLDLAMSPLSGGTCQPDHITMWQALKDTEYDLGYDIDKLVGAENVLKDCLQDYFMPPEATMVNPEIVFSPLPGGALTANTQMMRDNGVLDKYPQVVTAMREVVEKGGFGTSVTPISQFYFQQAFNNVMFGRWAKIADGYGKMVLGYFGKTPWAPDPEIIRIASEQLGLEPTTRSPRDINDENPKLGIKPAIKALEEAGLPVTDENIMIAATCDAKGIEFLKGNGQNMIRKNVAKKESTPKADAYTVSVDGNAYSVKLDGNVAIVNGRQYNIDVKTDEQNAAAPSKASQAPASQETSVCAPLPASIFKIIVKEGQRVQQGEKLLILEAMKMETDIVAPTAGIVQRIAVSVGQQVPANHPLLTIA